MLDLFNRIPSFVQVILVVILILAVVYIIIAIIDAIDGRRIARQRDRHEQRKLYDAILRINKSCERIGDILASTDFLVTIEVTVEETEERVIPHD